MRLRHAAVTDIGLARESNEDGYLASPPLFAVADGMGGHQSGDVASQTALETLTRELQNGGDLAAAVRTANSEIHQRARTQPELAGMGTTITAMIAGPKITDIVHVGDSRAYLFRDGNLRRLTVDHTVVERMVREGKLRPEEAQHHPQRAYLERALGVDPDVDVDSYQVETAPGDRILLCTDGLTSMVDEVVIRDLLADESDPGRASQRLVETAVAAGGSDNITVVVIDYPEEAAAESSKRSRKIRWRKPPRIALLALGVAVALAVSLFTARTVALSRWYVGSDGGRVVVLRGVHGFIDSVEERTDIPVDSLPGNYRDRLVQGISATSRDDAKRIVSNLREIQADLNGQGGAP